jgi:hypothetical protein
MSTQIQRRRGTTAEHSTFTGVEGELTVDTTKDTAVVHDGTTVGGHPLQKQYPPLGSAAAPTYTFTGDTNTGIYSPGADQVAVATNGVGRLVIDSSGRLLIGETAAATSESFLTVKNGSGACELNIMSSSTSASVINLGDTGDYNIGRIKYDQSGNSLQFDTFNAERLRITSAGLVGIGNSSPATTLDVVGGYFTGGNSRTDTDTKTFGLLLPHVSSATNPVNIIGALSTTGQNLVYIGGSDSNLTGTSATTIHFYTAANATTANGTERMRITSAGNVGIGTVSPGAIFQTKVATNYNIGFNTDNDGVGRITCVNDAFTAASPLSVSGADLRLQISGVEKARLDSSGRLLVGTSTARSNFFNTTASAALQIEGTATARRASIISCEAASDTGGSLVLAHQRSGAGGGNTIVNNGDIVGRLSYQGNDGAELDGTPGANDMPGRLVFSTTSDGASSPTERLRIDSSGRVGIGTQSPGSALHVVGVALFNTAQSFIANSATGSVGTFQYNGTSIGDIGSGNQTLSGGSTGDVALTSRAGALVFGINTVEKARLDSSGRLLVGTSSALTGSNSQYSKVVALGNSANNAAGYFSIAAGSARGNDEDVANLWFTDNGAGEYASIRVFADGAPGSGDYPGRLVFSTTADGASSPTERMRITNYGQVFTYADSVNAFAVASSGATSATNACIYLQAGATGIDTGTITFRVQCNGDVDNQNNSYGAISDVKLKENIVDASSQWNDLKALQVRNYNFKPETGYKPTPKSVLSPKKLNSSPLVSSANPLTATKTATTLAPSPRASTTRCST